MRLIPVLDLIGGVAVHARRGNRSRYKPVESRLAPGTSDPVTLCRAFRAVGFQEVYIADLDAIAGRGSHRQIVDRILAETGLRVLLDPGIRTASEISSVLCSGVHGVLVGSETLATFADLPEILRFAGAERILFSLDLREGQVLSPDPEVSGVDPVAVLHKAVCMGVSRAVLIDLSTVGAESGPNLTVAQAAADQLPDFPLWIGGGVRNQQDLRAVSDAGASGALIATCLHTGALTEEETRAWL